MRVPLLNFERGPGVPLLNFEGSPGSWILGSRGPESWGPGPTFTPCPFFCNFQTILVKINWELQHVGTVSTSLGNISPRSSPTFNVVEIFFLTLIF